MGKQLLSSTALYSTRTRIRVGKWQGPSQSSRPMVELWYQREQKVRSSFPMRPFLDLFSLDLPNSPAYMMNKGRDRSRSRFLNLHLSAQVSDRIRQMHDVGPIGLLIPSNRRQRRLILDS